MEELNQQQEGRQDTSGVAVLEEGAGAEGTEWLLLGGTGETIFSPPGDLSTFEIHLSKNPAHEAGSNLINLDSTGRWLQHLAKKNPSPREPPQQRAFSEHLSLCF